MLNLFDGDFGDNYDAIKKQVTELLQGVCPEVLPYLEQTDFFTAPASAHYHSAHFGGLMWHSYAVCLVALKIKAALDLEISDDTIIKTALLHDICKVDFYTIESRNRKNAFGKWEKYNIYGYKDKNAGFGHGEDSVITLLQQGVKLTQEEAMAIRWHMGFSEQGKLPDVSKAFIDYPLAVVINSADVIASAMYEKQGVVDDYVFF